MGRKSFTIMEVIVVVIIIGILATLGFPAYRNVIEDSRAKVCQANLSALQTALDVYAMEHDVMPGDLSELPAKYLERGYAKVLQQKGAWKIKLAYFILGIGQGKLAYAGLLTDDLAKGNASLLTCPDDTTPPAAGGRSYGVHAGLAGMTSHDYRNLRGDTLMIGDCEAQTFDGNSGRGLEMRHRRFGVGRGGSKAFCLAVRKDKAILKEDTEGNKSYERPPQED